MLTEAERTATAGSTNFVHKATGYAVAVGLSREVAQEVAKRVGALEKAAAVATLASGGNAEAVKLLRDIVDAARRFVASKHSRAQEEPSPAGLPSDAAQRRATAKAVTTQTHIALYRDDTGEHEIPFPNADPAQAFKSAALYVHEHVLANAPGIVVTPQGILYLVSKEARSAKRMVPAQGTGGGGASIRAANEILFLEAAQAVEYARTPSERKHAASTLRRVAQIIDRDTQEMPAHVGHVHIVPSTRDLENRLAKDPQLTTMRQAFDLAYQQAERGDRKSAEAAVKIGTAIDERIQEHRIQIQMARKGAKAQRPDRIRI